MPIFKSTQEILENPWVNVYGSRTANTTGLPCRNEWDYRFPLEINDVHIWEQVYFQEGNLGIYAAWDPFAEFFIVTYNMFLNTPYGIKTFYGPTASQEVYNLARELGIELSFKNVWTSSTVV